MPSDTANLRAAGAFAANLAACGVREVCLSPGSRSAPLAFAFSAQANVRVRVITDERDAAYFAVGIARATDRPVAILCTSGTAAANFTPAVAEAALAHVPLVVLTADRPPELRDTGAPQTIRQSGLYAGHVHWSVDAATPDDSLAIEPYFATLACRAVATAVRCRGPVHLNFPFREPLWSDGALAVLSAHRDATPLPYVRVAEARRCVEPALLEELARRLAAEERGLVFCGPSTGGSRDIASFVALARALGWPLLVDALSGLRYGALAEPSAAGVIVDGYDALVRSPAFRAAHRPGIVLRFGGLPTSKALLQFLAGEGPREQIAVTASGAWADPDFVVSEVVEGEHGAVAAALARGLDGRVAADRWLRRWVDASRAAMLRLGERVAAIGEPFEGAVARAVVNALPDGAQLFVGNSLPVRALEGFAGATERRVAVLANRGASGIDGVTATALGVAASCKTPCVLLTGDLSFLHDIGALQIAHRHRLHMTIVVIDNDGGGIFSFLERPSDQRAFERLFATPHGLDVRAAVEMCGGKYVAVESCRELATVLCGMVGGDGLGVIRIRTERERTVRLHAECIDAALAALGGETGTAA